MNRSTWSKPNGDWGVNGVDWTAIPHAAYGALCKLKHMEDLVEQLNDPDISDWQAEDAINELLGADVVSRIKVSELDT